MKHNLLPRLPTPSLWSVCGGTFRSWWKPLRLRMRRPVRNLKLHETLALGEKRFVAVVSFGEQRFLIGGAAYSISLLTALPQQVSFRELLDRLQPQGKVR
jgi:flagellar biogenesis protein FliO